MPSTSDKQHKFMEAVANNPKFAKKVGVPQAVGQDFAEADKVKMPKSRPDLQGINKQKTDYGSMNLFKRGGVMATKKMAMFEKSGKDVEKKGMKEGSKADMALDKKQMMGMKKGGMPMIMKDGKKMPAFAAKKGGMAKFAKGGAIDGIAQKGKTRGKNC
jgi:hypothetical protein